VDECKCLPTGETAENEAVKAEVTSLYPITPASEVRATAFPGGFFVTYQFPANGIGSPSVYRYGEYGRGGVKLSPMASNSGQTVSGLYYIKDTSLELIDGWKYAYTVVTKNGIDTSTASASSEYVTANVPAPGSSISSALTVAETTYKTEPDSQYGNSFNASTRTYINVTCGPEVATPSLSFQLKMKTTTDWSNFTALYSYSPSPVTEVYSDGTTILPYIVKLTDLMRGTYHSALWRSSADTYWDTSNKTA
jgi:hypothetical protein